MKPIIGSICLSLFCLGVAWVEYQMLWHFRSILVLFAVASVLGALSVALFRAPEGYEQPDGFRIRPRDRRSGLARHARLFQRQVRREWT
jgi:hypothetical protein